MQYDRNRTEEKAGLFVPAPFPFRSRSTFPLRCFAVDFNHVATRQLQTHYYRSHLFFPRIPIKNRTHSTRLSRSLPVSRSSLVNLLTAMFPVQFVRFRCLPGDWKSFSSRKGEKLRLSRAHARLDHQSVRHSRCY